MGVHTRKSDWVDVGALRGLGTRKVSTRVEIRENVIHVPIGDSNLVAPDAFRATVDDVALPVVLTLEVSMLEDRDVRPRVTAGLWHERRATEKVGRPPRFSVNAPVRCGALSLKIPTYLEYAIAVAATPADRLGEVGLHVQQAFAALPEWRNSGIPLLVWAVLEELYLEVRNDGRTQVERRESIYAELNWLWPDRFPVSDAGDLRKTADHDRIRPYLEELEREIQGRELAAAAVAGELATP